MHYKNKSIHAITQIKTNEGNGNKIILKMSILFQ